MAISVSSSSTSARGSKWLSSRVGIELSPRVSRCSLRLTILGLRKQPSTAARTAEIIARVEFVVVNISRLDGVSYCAFFFHMAESYFAAKRRYLFHQGLDPERIIHADDDWQKE